LQDDGRGDPRFLPATDAEGFNRGLVVVHPIRALRRSSQLGNAEDGARVALKPEDIGNAHGKCNVLIGAARAVRPIARSVMVTITSGGSPTADAT
jgi:hypothetical protein